MGLEQFIFIGIMFVVPFMYGLSMLWYFFISKNRGVYAIEVLAFIGGAIGLVILISIGYSADMATGLASIFAMFFVIPIVSGSIVAAVLVKLTIYLITVKDISKN